jgi:uncharacterized spore protein YtfJ
MNLREARDAVGTVVPDADPSRVYGEPYETADGATVITVAKVRGARAKPIGVFVIKDGNVRWSAAVDGERVAMMGIFVGLVSATLAGVAMVRRPPWPDLKGDISRWR